MSIISLDNISLILSDLNGEISYKISENESEQPNRKFLTLLSDGDNHKILLLNQEIWCSKLEIELENIPTEVELTLNERKNFEKHLRLLINDKINSLKNLEM